MVNPIDAAIEEFDELEEDDDEVSEEDISPIERLRRDLRDMARNLQPREARSLVDTYYMIQENRTRSSNQCRALADSGEPFALIEYIDQQSRKIESQIKTFMDLYTMNTPLGQWSRSIVGIGPVLAAALQANIDVSRSQYVTQVWRFAGQDPSIRWLGKEGANQVVNNFIAANHIDAKAKPTEQMISAIALQLQRKPVDVSRLCHDKAGNLTWASTKAGLARRPWSARLKVVCWKIGQSFNKSKSKEGSYYGPLLNQRKQLEWARNISGEYADIAREVARTRNIEKGDILRWYEGKVQMTPGWAYVNEAPKVEKGDFTVLPRATGIPMLSPGHIDSRARRWVVKLFLSHWHSVAYELHFGRPAPMPYVIDHLGHKDFMEAPNIDMIRSNA